MQRRYATILLFGLLSLALCSPVLAQCTAYLGGCTASSQCCQTITVGVGNVVNVASCCVADLLPGVLPTSGTCVPTVQVLSGQSCIENASPGGSSSGDPLFTGFDGSSFQFMGEPFTYWNLLSERDHQVTAFFTPAELFDHNGTYITAFGLQYGVHRLAVRVEPSGNLTVELNDKPLVMPRESNSLMLRLTASPRHPGSGNMTLNYELYKPYYGQHLEIRTPVMTLSIWSVAPGTIDEGGQVQPAYLDSKVFLVSPPADNAMSGVLGDTYVALMKHLVEGTALGKAALKGLDENRRHKASGLFASDFESNLFKPPARREARALLQAQAGLVLEVVHSQDIPIVAYPVTAFVNNMQETHGKQIPK